MSLIAEFSVVLGDTLPDSTDLGAVRRVPGRGRARSSHARTTACPLPPPLQLLLGFTPDLTAALNAVAAAAFQTDNVPAVSNVRPAYSLEGNVLRVTATYDLKFPGNPTTPANAADLMDFETLDPVRA